MTARLERAEPLEREKLTAELEAFLQSRVEVDKEGIGAISSSARRAERHSLGVVLEDLDLGVGIQAAFSPVPPASLETQRELSVRSLFEPLVRERRPGDVAGEPLETSPVARGDADVGVEAHATVLGYACRCLRVGFIRVSVQRLDPIAEASPWLAAMRAGGDAGPQRCGGQQCQQRLFARKGIRVVSYARREPRFSGC